MRTRAALCLLIAGCAVSEADTGTVTETASGSVAATEPATKAVTAAVPEPALGDPDVAGSITKVHIVSGAGVPDDQPKRALAADGVTMYAVVVVDGRHYSDAPRVKLGRQTITTRPLAEAPAFTLAWQRVEPTQADTSNEASGQFRFEAIEYATTALAAGVGTLAADVRPTLTPDHGDGVGTMRYRIVVTQGDRTIASPGADARRGRGSGGLADAVHRISLRRDDTYLGVLTEMYGQPYIWASAGTTAKTHQSERLEGSDCADFVVYGQRRLGNDIPYVWSGGLTPYTRGLGKGTRGDDGIYRDADGEPLAFPRPGDLILFPRHVGALTEDRGTIGVLDDEDILMHTLFDSPREQRLADSGYADKPAELRRWK